MTEYDFRDNLVTLARFNSPTEAELARVRLANEGIESSVDGGATGTWLNHMGADLIGATLSVRQGDLREAREVLSDVLNASDDSSTNAEMEDEDDYDADWSGEDWADDDDDDEEEYSEEPAGTPPLSRAFRAAIIGMALFPPLLNIYSMKVIFDHRLWEPRPREQSANWRFYVALAANAASLFIVWFYYQAIFDGFVNWH